MLAVRGRIENRQAILRIGFQPFVPETFGVQPEAFSVSVPVHEYSALIDTGAQRTCIGRSVIQKEGLRHHGKRAIQNVHGVERHYLYWVHLGFMCERLGALSDREGGKSYYGLPDPLEVIDIADNSWFQAIIGMDVLSQCSLRIDADSTFSLILPA